MIEVYLRRWQLHHAVEFASTSTSRLYRVQKDSQTLVLKVFTEIGAKDEAGGSAALQLFAGRGSVQLLEWDAGAQLLEFIPGPTLLSLVQQGRDEDATRMACEVLRQLHLTPARPDRRLVPLRTRLGSLLSYTGNNPAIAEAGAIAETLVAQPEKECVLHGDLHHENVLHSPERGWVAIDPKGLFGEALFDAANLVFNPVSLPELVKNEARIHQQISRISSQLRFNPDRFRKWCIVYGALSAVWSEEDGHDPSLALTVLRLLNA